MHVLVKDVMTRRVISINGNTPFKDIAEALITHAVSAVPVVDGEGRVIGVVSEADLLHKEEFREQFRGENYQPPLTRLNRRPSADKARGDVAQELMTTPVVTVSMDAPVVIAGRLMECQDVKRLPVVDRQGRLVGIISRRDLLKVFVRSDRDIEREIRVNVLMRSLWMDTSRVCVTVDNGVVTLSGRMTLHSDAQIALWMAQQVNGVVDVLDHLTWDRDNIPA
ncbi:CBS domain-containing protein [Streptosporangium sp. NPDC000396]|uniref:CBS domain-containing protein n=1 Tax=Streptosporangium sp. NPDC000396 TaxID=3366185 RepID=UPI00368CBD89